MKQEVLQQAATEARGIAIDGVVSAGHVGHLGLPLGAAELGAVLYGGKLRVNPENPRWINRDRFVLSAGHGSMFLYGWLHLSGFNIRKEDLAAFRTLHSITPGHPEFGETDGVECTTGPLGQGVGNAVGMAVSAKMAQSLFNTADHAILDYKVVCLAGDGCMQEGVAMEACAFAGHQQLDNLILIFDSNDVTLDAPGEASQSEDTAGRFRAIGWDVQEIDGHDLGAIEEAYDAAHDATSGKPQLIIAKTEIGRGIPEVAGTWKAHGEGGSKFEAEARQALGLPGERFHVSEAVRQHFAELKRERISANAAWDQRFARWKQANPAKAEILEKGYARKLPGVDELFAQIPQADPEKAVATRSFAGGALNALAQGNPLIVSGSADLHGSTKNYLEDAGGDFAADNRAGRNIRFGIREHAMGAIVNGFGYEGLFCASGATFFTFSDYMRPSVRLSALSKLPVLWYWTHDSVGVGVDGPTHQPVETIAAVRAIPGLDTIKPADAEETAGALVAAMERQDGPTALSLTRQNVPVLGAIPVEERRRGVLRGAYIAKRESGPLTHILLSCGSELSLALEAAEKIESLTGEPESGGLSQKLEEVVTPGVRVVSMPCEARFERQPAEYQEEVLPTTCRKRVAVEAAVAQSWWKYVGLDGTVVSIERYGLSAPGDEVMTELGITVEAVVEAVRSLG